jgi:hypothetical protein
MSFSHEEVLHPAEYALFFMPERPMKCAGVRWEDTFGFGVEEGQQYRTIGASRAPA